MSTAERSSMRVTVYTHVHPATEIEWKVKAAENRVWVSLEGGDTDVTVFAGRSELMRLRDTLDAVLAELDTQRAALDERGRESAA